MILLSSDTSIKALTPALFDNGRWGYINAQGENAIAADFLEAGWFENDRAFVTFDDGHYGYINPQGKEVKN